MKSIESSMRRFLANKIAIAYTAVIFLFLVGGIINSGFLHAGHLMNVLSLSSFLGIVALAQMIVVLAGGEGIDLSVGSVISLSTVIASQVMDGENARLPLAIMSVVVVAALIGGVNGVGISLFKIPPLVMTLANASVVQGLALVYTQGQPKGRASEALITIGTGRTLLVPNMLWVWIIMALAAIFFLERTRWGKLLSGTGANDTTARLSGVNTRRVRAMAYVGASVTAAIGGLLLLGYTGTSYLDLGSAYIMPSVAAIVIGGVALAGGEGSYSGVIAGAIVLTTIGSILISLRMGEGGRQIVYGLIILVVLTFYTRQRRNT